MIGVVVVMKGMRERWELRKGEKEGEGWTNEIKDAVERKKESI